jgi:hypothetical protein
MLQRFFLAPVLLSLTAVTLFSQTSGIGPLAGDEFTGPFNSWGNVRSFGAAGDGYSDDTNAFQAALNSLGTTNSFSILYIPAGTYRITRTLSLVGRNFVSIVGEHPDRTTIKWAGPAGGVMLDLNGLVDSSFTRMNFDGGNSAAVGIDQSWDGNGTFFDSHDEYADNIFQNLQIGIRGGHLGHGAADSVVSRCRFLRNTIAGLSVENWNALNWFVRDSYFQDNYDGVTNTLGAGNFHVLNCMFQHSIRADIEITNTEYFSVRHNYSSGSGYFFLANASGTAPDPITFQGNIIIDPTIQAISIGNAGPVLLVDNIVRSAATPSIVVREGYSFNPVNSNVVSVGNTIGSSNPYQVGGRLLSIGDTLTSIWLIAVTPPTMPSSPNNLGRALYEVPANSGAAAIQQIINTAVAQHNGQRPVVHFPPGLYQIGQTLVVPSGSDVQLVGDGGNSTLLWTGAAGGGPVLQLAAPSHATIQNLHFHGNNTVNGINVDVADQTGSTVFMDQANLKLNVQNNLLVNGLQNANISANVLYNDYTPTGLKVVGPGFLNSQNSGGRVDIFGGGDGSNQLTYDISGGGRLVAEDVWYEGGAATFANFGDSGYFTISGARVYNNDPAHGGSGAEVPPFAENNFNGKISILNTKIGRGGIWLSGQGSGTQLLALNVDGPIGTQNFFQNYTPSSQAALAYSNLALSTGGSVAVPDQLYNIGSLNDFITSMIGDLRTAKPLILPSLNSTAGDVRMYRVVAEQSVVGIQAKSSSAYVAPPVVTTPVANPPLTVTMTAPYSGQTVSGTITVSASAANATQVQFLIDGANLGAPSSLGFGTSLNTANYANGTHTVSAIASDASGRTATAAAVSFTINNASNTPAPVSSPSSPSTPFITGFGASNLRNNYTGWLGFELTVGGTPINVTALGRVYVAGNSGSHVVKLVKAADGSDVPGASATVYPASGTPGQFTYVNLSSAVTLSANTSYYLVSQEVSGGDYWYDFTSSANTSVGSIIAAIYTNPAWVPVTIPGYTYVPANLQYTTGSVSTPAPTPSGPPSISITSPAPNSTVSGKITVTASASAASGLSIQSVMFRQNGSLFATATGSSPYSGSLDTTTLANGSYQLTAVATDSAGNSTTSSAVTLTISNAVAAPPPSSGSMSASITSPSNGSTVSGRITVTASAVPISGQSIQYVYFRLNGGLFGTGSSYPYGAILDTTSFANGTYQLTAYAVDWSGNNTTSPGVTITIANGTGSAPSAPAGNTVSGTPFITGFTPSIVRTNLSGWMGMTFSTGPQAITLTSLGRMCLAGNSGSHALKLVSANGTDLSGGSTTVSMAGCTPGKFQYAALPSAITLQANTSYYLLSQETNGGDSGYDYSQVNTTSVGTVNAPVYSSGSSYVSVAIFYGSPSYCYVPLNFLYQ